jgi:dTDP-4-dehydrorhamnose 3,5-epimerase
MEKSLKLIPTQIDGCYQVDFLERLDNRGLFVKTFQSSVFDNLGLESNFTESFYSLSQEGVLRGMHFQIPPSDGSKLIYCLQGAILDVAVDLRVGSPSYGGHARFELSANQPSAAYIPRGMAHGFLVLKGPALVMYHVSSEYDSKRDSGVLWNSIDFKWPCATPICSERDSALTPLSEFTSPFRFTAEKAPE